MNRHHLAALSLFTALCIAHPTLAEPPITKGRSLDTLNNVFQLLNTNACANCDLAEVHLRGNHLIGTDLRGANLTGADLSWANLEGADLTGADLTGANLTGANLTNASLVNAQLHQVNLSQAQLYHVDIAGASLQDLNLVGATVVGTPISVGGEEGSLEEDILPDVKSLEEWNLPLLPIPGTPYEEMLDMPSEVEPKA